MNDPGRMTGHIVIPGQQQFMPAFSAGSLPAGRQPLPKQLTAAIKSCSSLERLSQLFHAHQAVLNPIHIAAMITKLPKLDNSMHNAAMATGSSDLPWILSTASAQQLQLRQLLQQLLMRLKVQGCGEYSPRGVANIVWALAKLQCAPDPELRHMLLDKFCSQLPTAVPQDISNVLWGVAKLTKERTAVLTNISGPTMNSAPAVLQPMGMGMPAGGSLSSPSSGSSPSLASSALSAQDWGMMGLHALGGPADPSLLSAGAPLLAQDQVRLLLQHLCQQLHTASVQTISNSLWAVVVLQQEHQWCMCNCLAEVQSLLSVFCKQPHQALPGHIQPVIRCMAQLATTCSNHAGSSWISWQPGLLQLLLDYLNSQREHMEMHHVSSVLRDVAQVVCLHLLLAKQTRDRQQGSGAAGRDTSYGNACMPAGSKHSSSGRGSPSPSSSSSRPGAVGSAPHTMSLNTISVEEEAEEMLARLAATGGPQDASSTVVALAMLQPQLEQLGLQQGVAGLCSLLPPAALPQLGEEVGQRLLAAASSTAAARAAAGPAPGLQVVLPEQQLAALPPAVVGTPSAAPGSSSASNSSGSNVVLTGSGPEAGGSAAQQSTQHMQLLSGAPSPAGAAAAAGLAGPYSSSPGAAAAVSVPGNSSDSLRSHGSSIGEGELGSAHDFAMLQLQQQLPGSTGAAAEGCGGCTGDDGCTCPGGCNAADPHQSSGLVSPAVSSAEVLALAGLRPGSSSAAAAEGVLGPGGDSQEEAAARQLTHNIAYADSVYQLAEIFHAHSSVMDMIHITACITRLSKVLGTTPSAPSQAAAAALLPLLGGKLLQVLPHANARGIANVLWGYGRLRNLPQSYLLPALLEAFLRQLPTAACRDSAVVLWSLARLTEGQGMALVGVQTQLLQRLGRAVLEQLASAATAAMAPPSQQEHASAGAAVAASSTATTPDAAAAGAGGGSSSDTSAAPSSRDISNSLMALTRLGFVTETAEGSAAEDSKEPADAAAAAAAAAGSGAGVRAELAEQLASREGSGSQAATAAAAQLEGLSLQQVTAGPEAGSEALQQQSPRPAAAAASGEQPGTSQQQPSQGAQAAGQEARMREEQQQPAAAGAIVRLTLPLKPVQVIVKFLLRHAATAKTLDLQEAATALKQLGLQELHALVAAAIAAPHGGGVMGLSPPHAAAGSSQGHHAAHGPHGVQYIHHMAAAAAAAVAAAGAGGGAGGGSPLMPGMARFGGPGSRGGGGGGFVGHASSILARQRQSSGGAGAGHPAVSVGMPSSINLSGTQLAGLLQQQRRHQPLPVTGPAYGAGWLQQQGAGAGDPQFPGGGRGRGQQQQQQQQQYRVFVPGGAGSSSPGIRRSSGPQLVALAGPDAPAGAGVYQQGGYPAPAAAGAVLEFPGGYQQQQFGGQVQYQARPASGGQRQQHQQQQWAVPMPPMRQQSADMAQQQQQPQMFVAGGVQYMFVPQHMQSQQQQQQQQPGGYILQQPQQQQQQQQPEYVMMQVMQQAGGAGQQQQQPGSSGGQMYLVPAPMGSMVNIGMPAASMSGQQGLAGPAMTGPASNEGWMAQGGAQVVATSGQQQQPQLQMLQMPAAGAAGMGGQYAAAGAGPGYQVSSGMLMQVDMGAAAQIGAGSFAAVNLEAGGQPQQQMQQLYNVMQGGQFQQQQQQGLGVQQEPPGLFVQQQQQQQENLQQQQLPVMYMDPTTGYTFQGGQFSQ